ncbi:hypothetical protein EDB54_2844 [Vibrio crassostreae]|uniref:Uncharacterized protein n=1 Tax=Vibrio celticus TaxID=446372 RepID=A0A1C3JKF6_9VIBR|nr:hypothetical protein EDB53_2840 [Vibrio crassostreae]ROR69182.1 hypothetical protein EDB54_2844 [Vibrio crassostreae]SBT15681.1 hypothetical protein VCE7224_04486 [Vibrio celticus]
MPDLKKFRDTMLDVFTDVKRPNFVHFSLKLDVLVFIYES